MKEIYIIFECYDTGAECRRHPIDKAYLSLERAETVWLELSEKENDTEWWEIITFPLDNPN